VILTFIKSGRAFSSILTCFISAHFVAFPVDFVHMVGNADVMRPQSFCADQIKKTLKALKIATLEELVCALGQPSVRTVFRKLKELEYLCSYSHRGQYYTLQAVVRFDEDGLWEHRSVWFSRFGTLLNSVRSFVDRSTQGYTASELDGVLHVETSHALLQCVRENHLIREALGRGYLYLSASSSRAQAQRKARKRAERQAAIRCLRTNELIPPHVPSLSCSKPMAL